MLWKSSVSSVTTTKKMMFGATVATKSIPMQGIISSTLHKTTHSTTWTKMVSTSNLSSISNSTWKISWSNYSKKITFVSTWLKKSQNNVSITKISHHKLFWFTWLSLTNLLKGKIRRLTSSFIHWKINLNYWRYLRSIQISIC